MGDIVVLSVGDIVHNVKNGDIGLLLYQGIETGASSQGIFQIVVWRIYWMLEGDTIYTEEGIVNMVNTGYLVQYKNI